MFNFYSSGDEVLEVGPQDISILTGVSDSLRRYVCHKQEAFKGRNVLYGSGWAGWGFESNMTAQAVNAASPETLRDFPIFEQDPDEMFCAAISPKATPSGGTASLGAANEEEASRETTKHTKYTKAPVALFRVLRVFRGFMSSPGECFLALFPIVGPLFNAADPPGGRPRQAPRGSGGAWRRP